MDFYRERDLALLLDADFRRPWIQAKTPTEVNRIAPAPKESYRLVIVRKSKKGLSGDLSSSRFRRSPSVNGRS
jgi:hypothetical protein